MPNSNYEKKTKKKRKRKSKKAKQFQHFKASFTPKPLPKEWEWIKNIIEEAHFPQLGLPQRWKETREEDQKTAYDPSSKTTHHTVSGDEKKHKKSPVQFVKSTADHNPMPGTNQPDAVRFQLFNHPKFQEMMVNDVDGSKLVPCFTHGDFVKVESLQADHAQAKKQILMRQQELVKKLNEDKEFANFVMKLDGINKFFVKTQMEGDSAPKYYGTLFYYKIYFNDIDNLWLICQACNLQKSDDDTFEWLSKQWTFRKEFTNFLQREGVNNNGILTKISNKQGLAQVAIEWFWKRHASYISNAKEFFEEVTSPYKILNRKLDELISVGPVNAAEQLQAGIELKEGIMHEVSTMEGVFLPEAAEATHTVPLNISKGKTGKNVPVSLDDYHDAAQETIQKVPQIIREDLAKNILELKKKRQKIGNESEKDKNSAKKKKPAIQNKNPKQQKSETSVKRLKK